MKSLFFREYLLRGRVDCPLALERHQAHGDQIKYLAQVQDHAHYGCSHHEVGEHRFLGGPGHVAVHHVGTGADAALDAPGEPEAVVHEVEEVEESQLDGRLEEEAQQVGPPQPPVLLSRVVVETGLLAVLDAVLTLPLLAVRNVQNHQEGRARDEDKLKGPQADMGDREEVVVADVFAAGLPGVAVKVGLVVAPHALCRHHEHHHPEDEDDRQPDAPKDGGVLVGPAEQTLKALPIHASRAWKYFL